MGDPAGDQRARDLLEDRGLVFDDDDDLTPIIRRPTAVSCVAQEHAQGHCRDKQTTGEALSGP